jgi:urease accessory protein UreF
MLELFLVAVMVDAFSMLMANSLDATAVVRLVTVSKEKSPSMHQGARLPSMRRSWSDLPALRLHRIRNTACHYATALATLAKTRFSYCFKMLLLCKLERSHVNVTVSETKY